MRGLRYHLKRKSEDEKGELLGEDKRKFAALSDCFTEEAGSVSAETYETNKKECQKEVGKTNANKGHIKSIMNDTYNNRYVYCNNTVSKFDYLYSCIR